jgi:hypothetical protein
MEQATNSVATTNRLDDNILEVLTSAFKPTENDDIIATNHNSVRQLSTH